MSKKLLSWLLAVCMLFSMLPLNAFAVEAEPVDEDTAAADTLDPAEPEPADAPEDPAPEEAAQEDDLPSVQAELPEEEASVQAEVPEETAAQEALQVPVEGGEADAGDAPYDVTIQVGDIVRMETDRRDQWDYENERTWQRLDCYPDENVSVIIDGKIYNGYREYGDDWSQTGNLNDVQADIQDDYPKAELFWTSGEDGKNIWETGEYTATLCLRLPLDGQEEPYEVTQDYNVTVVPCPDMDLQVDATTASMKDVYLSEDSDGEYFYVSVYPRHITAILEDDTELSGDVHEVEQGLEQWYEDHEYPVPRIPHYSTDPKVYQADLEQGELQAGDVLIATFHFCGIEREYNVTLTDGPVVNLWAESITTFAGASEVVLEEDGSYRERVGCMTNRVGAEVNGESYNTDDPNALLSWLQDRDVDAADWGWNSDQDPDGEHGATCWTQPGKHTANFFIFNSDGETIATATYDVTLVASPITQVRASSLFRTWEANGRERVDWDHEWTRIECNPDQLTIVVDDNVNDVHATFNSENDDEWPVDALINTYRGFYDNFTLRWDTITNQNWNNQWYPSNNPYHAMFLIGGHSSAYYEVHVVNSPFDRVEVVTPDGAGIQRFDAERVDDGRIDCWPRECFIKLYKTTDDVEELVFEGPIEKPDDEAEEGTWLRSYLDQKCLPCDLWWESEEREDGTDFWHPGTELEGGNAWIHVCGLRSNDYAVTVVPMEIALEAGSVTMFEGDNQDAWTWDNQHFYRLDCCTENATATVNGTPYSFSGRDGENPWDLVNKLQKAGIPVDDWSWDNDESPDNHWTARDEAYTAHFALLYRGETVAECYYDVLVLENPIDHLDIPDIVRTTGQLSEEWDGWYRIDCNPDEVNIVLKNGTTLSNRDGWSGEQLRDMYISDHPDLRVLWHWDSDETRDNPWAVGNSHDAWQVIAGVTAHYNVTVIEPPFDAARLTDDPYYTMKRLDGQRDGRGCIDCRPDGDQIVVLYKDSGAFAWLQVDRPDDVPKDPAKYLGDYLESIGLHDYDWYWDSEESEDNPWQVGTTHQAWLVVAGVESYPYNVKVIPDPFVWGEAYTLNEDGEEDEGRITRSLEDRRNHAVWDDDEGRLDYDNQQEIIDCWPGELRFRLYDENNAVVFDGPIDAPEGEDETAENCMRGWLRSLGLNDDIDWASGETEDEPWPEDFVGKAWLQVCNRRAANYLVDVVGNPIEDIEVEDFQLFFEDYQLNDNPTNAQNPYANREYNVEPPRIKVTTTDGEVYEGDFWDVKNKIEEDYNFHADWDWYHDMYQGTGRTLQAYVTVGRAEYPFTVDLVDSHVSGVHVNNITRFLNDTFRERYWDEEQDEERWWDRIDCWPDYVEITFDDGRDPISGNPDRVRDRLREMYPDVRFDFIWESDETCDNRWTEPGEHDVNFYPCGAKGASCTYKVHVMNSPIQSVKVNAITRYVDDREWLEHIGEEGYDPINCWPDQVTVTLTNNGGTITGTPDEVREELEDRTGARVHMDWWSTEGWKDENGTVPRYKAGKTYKSAAWFVVSGVESNHYDVKVVQIPVASIHVDDMTVLDTDRDQCWWEENGNSYWWKHQSCWPDEISVTLKAGVQPVRDIPEDEWGIDTNDEGNVVLTGDTGHVEWLLREYYNYESRLRCVTDEEPLQPGVNGGDGSWNAEGSPYTGYCIMSWKDSQVEGAYGVTVIHSPIARIETDDIVRYESDRVESWDDDERWFRLRTEPDEIRVFLEDNTTNNPDFTGSVDEAKNWLREKFGDSVVVSSNWNNAEGPDNLFEAGQSYECRFSLGGCETTYQVDVREAPFESISVATVVRADTDTDHVRDNGSEYDRIDCWPDQVTVVMKANAALVAIPDDLEHVSKDAQGRVIYTGDPNSLWDFLWEYYRFDAHMGWDNEESASYHWTSGKTYRNGARFWLMDPIDDEDLTFGARYDVTVIRNPISNLTLGKILRYNNERFHTEDWDRGEKHEYDRLDCYPGWVSFDLYTNQGVKHYEGDFDEIFGSDEVKPVMRAFLDTGVRYHWYWDSEERWDNIFEVGGTYGVRLNLFGLNASSEVEVISSPIESIDDIDVWKFTTDIHEEQAWGEDGPVFDDEGNPVMDRRIDLYPGSITVKLVDEAPYNGKVYENENFWDLERKMEADFPGIHISHHFDMGDNPDELWGHGDYVCNLRFCGFEKDYTIHVVQNTVSGVEISPATVMADADVTFPFRVWYEDENGEWVRQDDYPLIFCEPTELTIHFTDREDITLTYDAEGDGNFMEQAEQAMTEYMGFDFPVYWYTDQSPVNPWAAGAHKATLVVGDYEQEYDVQVTRNLASMDAPVIAAQTYTGSAIAPNVRLVDNGYILVKDKDYKIAFKNNSAVGQATYTITGMGNYTGKRTGTFQIKARSISGATISAIAAQTYTGKALTPAPVVKMGTKTLKKGTDYTLTYTNNTKAGTATVKVTGKGNYTGTKIAIFTIKKANQAFTITAPASVVKNKTVKLAVTNAFGKLTYTTSNKNIATVTANGVVKGVKPGTVTITVKAAGDANHNAASKTVKIIVYEMAPPALPTVKAEATGISITLKTGTATKYRIMYRIGTGAWQKLVDVAKPKSGGNVTYLWKNAKNNTKYSFSVCLLNGSTQISDYNRTGKSIQFMAAPTLTNPSAGQVKAAWRACTNITGYQIQYTSNAGFTSGLKTVNINKAATVSTVVKSLKKGSTYYFRIRTFTTVKGKTTYSDWSGGRAIKLTK